MLKLLEQHFHNIKLPLVKEIPQQNIQLKQIGLRFVHQVITFLTNVG